MPGQHFRAGVVIVVRHPFDGTVLAFERADSPGAWQLPQGGLHIREEPVEGAWRELLEETGLGPSEVVVGEEYPDWVAYEWPVEVMAEHGRDGRRRGQVQRWFFFDALRADVSPVPDGREFVAWRWADPAWLTDHVVGFRQEPYRRVLGALRPPGGDPDGDG
jgi:putative (di)nucleoside polyphosphate hydrolase